MKRVLSIQDISCLGKCSLTVALPIISMFGVETSIVPTAVLSTHTMFKDFTFRDLTDDLDPIREHWLKEGFEFDAIYTGYLGSDRQISLVKDYFSSFKKENTKIIVDPAMADGGKLYTGFDKFFVKKMASLCSEADIILPNISEAALLTGTEYPGEDASEEKVKELLIKLSNLGARLTVITGTLFKDGTLGFTGYNRDTKEFFSFGVPRVDYKSHGTGDIFASTFTGAVVKGFDEFEALKIASKYTAACIEATYNDPESCNYSVNFEEKLPYLLELIK